MITLQHVTSWRQKLGLLAIGAGYWALQVHEWLNPSPYVTAYAASTIIAVASIAVAVASTAASLYAQSEQTAGQNHYQKAVQRQRDSEIAENYKLSIATMHDQHKNVQDRIRQEGEAAVTEEQRNATEAAKARATSRTAAGEAGVAGLNVDALMGDFLHQEAGYRYGVRRNLEISTDQLSAEMEGFRAGAQGRVNSISPYMREPVGTPSYLSETLKIGGKGLEAYDRFKSPAKGPSATRTMPTDSDW
jgi:hypothetical protein